MEVTTLFVNNIPPNVHWRWLGWDFQRIGKVVDVFMPRKKSFKERRIGFVRFALVGKAKRAQWNLNGVWFLSHKIGVNIARFNPRKSFWRKTEALRGVIGQEVGSYRNNVNHNQVQSQQVSGRKTFSQFVLEGSSNSRSLPEVATRKDVSNGGTSLNADKELEESWCKRVIDVENLHWLERSITGKIKDNLDLDIILKWIKSKDFSGVLIRKFSGYECLITFEDFEVFLKMKEDEWKLLWGLFDTLALWSENTQAVNRNVWVACYGVLIHAQNIVTFQNIAEKLGDFIRMDCVSLEFKSFTKELNLALKKYGLME
ncbi:hypothetical protein REPUB_Repub11eG0026500 [Reevesia pubescens]